MLVFRGVTFHSKSRLLRETAPFNPWWPSGIAVRRPNSLSGASGFVSSKISTWAVIKAVVTPPETQHVPWRLLVGRCISYWISPFLGDMLVFRGVFAVYRGLALGGFILDSHDCIDVTILTKLVEWKVNRPWTLLTSFSNSYSCQKMFHLPSTNSYRHH